MANLIIICGPQAVGKMTVAESLRDKIWYNMMINHDSIEVSDRIFVFNTPAQIEFNYFFREKAFDLCVKHIIDLIFTYVAAFDMKEEIEYLKKIENQFVKNGGNIYFVELSTTIDTRLERNKTPHRLEKKLQKKDIKWSEENLHNNSANHKLNTDKDKILFKNHIKIDNTKLLPDEVSNITIDLFKLTSTGKGEKEYKYEV